MSLPGPALIAIGRHSCARSIQVLLGEGRVGAALNAVCEVWVWVNGLETLTEGTVAIQEQLRALSHSGFLNITVILD